MPEPAEEVHARVVAAVGEDGHLPAPPSVRQETFPWEVVDGAVVPRAVHAPDDEPLRAGDGTDRPCAPCSVGFDPALVVWEDEHWVLTHGGAPSGLPLSLVLHSRAHLDLGELDDELASQLGRITNRLVRIIENLPHVARVQVSRVGDDSSHFHQSFFSRIARLHLLSGATTMEWDQILPPGPEHVWREDLHLVATKLANWGGDARA